jgi:Na+/melibiose symporter-like transporter
MRASKAAPHPELAPRLEALRAAQEDREYARMVGTLAKDENVAARDAAEMSTYRSQLGVGVNLIVSMATMFTVGCYAGGTEEEPYGARAIMCGLALMLLAMGVEMSLFLIGAIRVDEKVHKREASGKTKGVKDRTKLPQHTRRLKDE